MGDGGQDITNLRYVGAYVFHTCRTGQMFPWRKNGPTRRRLDRAEYEEGKESFSIIFADEKCPLSSPQCPGSWGCPIRLTTTKNMTFQILLKIINAGTRLIFGASRSNLQPLARARRRRSYSPSHLDAKDGRRKSGRSPERRMERDERER